MSTDTSIKHTKDDITAATLEYHSTWGVSGKEHDS